MNTCSSRTSGGEHVPIFGTFWMEMSCILVPGSKPETSGETLLYDTLLQRLRIECRAHVLQSTLHSSPEHAMHLP